MKKLLALILSIALCFTVFAGCFATSAAPVTGYTFGISATEVTSDGGDVVVTVSGKYTTIDTAQYLVVTLPEDVTFKGVKNGVDANGESVNPTENDVFYYESGKEIRFIEAYDANVDFAIEITVNVPAYSENVANEYVIKADAQAAAFDAASNEDITTIKDSVTITVPAPHVHQAAADAAWQNNADNHWKVCEDHADVKVEEAAHTAGDAAVEDGYTVVRCSVCDYVISSVVVEPEVPEHTCDFSVAGVVTKRPTTTETGVRTFTCECGKTDEEVIPVAVVKTETDGNTYKVGTNLTLESSIKIGFLLRPAFVDDAVDTYALFTKPLYNDDGTFNSNVYFALEKEDIDDYRKGETNERRRFLFAGVAAKEMGTKVHYEFYRELANGTFECVVGDYSIADYVQITLEKETKPAILRLVMDLVNYGAAAQNELEYNRKNLVTEMFTEYLHLASTTRPAYENCFSRVDNANKTLRLGIGLELGSELAIWVNLQTPDKKVYNGDISGLRAKCVYNDVYGAEQVVWIESSEFVVANTGHYKFTFNSLSAKEMATEVTFEIYKGETLVSDTIHYSVESNAYAVFNAEPETDTMYILMDAILKYGASAKAAL